MRWPACSASTFGSWPRWQPRGTRPVRRSASPPAQNLLEHCLGPALGRCQQRVTPVRAVRRTIGHGHALRLPSPLARSPCRRAIRSSRPHPPASRTRVHWRTRHACRSRAGLISHSDGSGTWPGIREVHGRYIPGPYACDVKPPADLATRPGSPHGSMNMRHLSWMDGRSRACVTRWREVAGLDLCHNWSRP